VVTSSSTPTGAGSMASPAKSCAASWVPRMCGPSFPGETFRVLKEKEERKYGEYRTRRLVLEAWDRLEEERVAIPDATHVHAALAVSPFVTAAGVSSLPTIKWIPVAAELSRASTSTNWKPNCRQAVVVAWIFDQLGGGNAISSYQTQKHLYFQQRSGLAEVEADYKEFARGPYSPKLTYVAGALAKKRNYWEVRGDKVVRLKNMGQAIAAAGKLIANASRARWLCEQLARLSDDDLGGLATVDYAGREVYKNGQAITPENILAYFLAHWTEKVGDQWYTAENIASAARLLNEFGLFRSTAHQELSVTRPGGAIS
jgi:hypothetical protein